MSKQRGGTCPFALPQNGGGGTADYAVGVAGGIGDQAATQGQGNLIAMKGATVGGGSRKRISSLKKLLKRIKSLSKKNRTGGRGRGKKSRKNYSRRRR